MGPIPPNGNLDDVVHGGPYHCARAERAVGEHEVLNKPRRATYGRRW